MTTPKKAEILRKAKGISVRRMVMEGLPSITPTEAELKETGAFEEARLDLMRVDQQVLSEQRRYLSEMAGEMKLTLIPKTGLTVLKKETGYEWTNGWTRHKKRVKAKPKPPPIKVRKPKRKRIVKKPTRKPKKRKKRKSHGDNRAGRTMRKLRKIDGVKVFSFPEHIWKVRKPRKKRRRK